MLQFLVVRTFYLYQVLLAFSGFYLEVWVGRSGPALVCLRPISLIRSGTQLQDAGLGTLDAGHCFCALLFSIQRWCVSFRYLWDGEVRILWYQDYRHSLSLGRSTDVGSLSRGQIALRRTERSTGDGTLKGGLGALFRTEHSTEDRALFSRQNSWQRIERSTQGGTVNAGLNNQRKMESLTQDSKIDGRWSALRRTQNAWRSSLSGATERLKLFSVLCS